MSFPLIRPEDVEAMTEQERQLALRRLRRACREAAVRHWAILDDRARRQQAEAAAERLRIAELRRGLAFTEAERLEAERVLYARRILVQSGLHAGDGTRADDLRAAHAAVRAGSRNRYLLALNRERERLAWETSRSARRAMATRRGARVEVAS